MSFAESRNTVRGITLIELLVVTAVIGILGALLLMGIQSAREASRRLACANNLKQIGLAMNRYEAMFQVYPQGLNGGLGIYSGHVMLLPFIEQTNLYHGLNFVAAGPLGGFHDGGCNSTVGRTKVSAFCCPSDPDATFLPTTNYAWNGGLGDQRVNFFGTFCTTATQDYRYISQAAITDGLSHTAAMSEWKIGRVHSSDDSTVVFSIPNRPGEPYTGFVERCQASTRQTTSFGSWTKNARWRTGAYGSTILNFNSLPGSLSCWNNGQTLDLGNWPAGGYHPQGVNVLFHDSHVSHYSDATPLKVWQSISTRSSGDNMNAN